MRSTRVGGACAVGGAAGAGGANEASAWTSTGRGSGVGAESAADLRQLVWRIEHAAPEEAESLLFQVRAYAEQEAQRTQETLAQLTRFVDLLGGLPGRKAVFYVCDGLPSRPGDPPNRASPRTPRIQRPPALPGGRFACRDQNAGASAFCDMPRRSFTTPIRTPRRRIVNTLRPSITLSQFMWVGAMKKSDSSQPRVASRCGPA